ncbi:MAG: 2Fe-2S iron-sulfur cluster binding domain-containing protein [Bacteroidetes bacterium]|nr:2Fe-2S iron-sulfur cluster binding domain-containing protein [Bacteroidota bacterium]
MAKFHSLKVKDIKRETAEAVSISFELPTQLIADYQYKQGQYLTLKLKVNGEEIRRSYSVCTSPFAEKELRIAIKEVSGGRASTYLNRHLKVGDVLEVMTPMGNFHTPLSGSNKKNYVLFAGGSGITPMMSILKSVLYIEKQSTITLIYANKNEDSTIFKSEIEKIAEANKDKVQVIFINETPAQAGDALYTGMLTPDKAKAIVEKHVNHTLHTDFFICGPGPMMENVKQVLEQKNITKEKIHIEYFTSVIEAVANAEKTSSNAASGGDCQVTVLQYGVETTFNLATNGNSVLDAAIENGVDAPFSCKGAVCCTCRAKVIEGEVSMDANFALTDNEVAQGYVLTCQAHPITAKVVLDYDAS